MAVADPRLTARQYWEDVWAGYRLPHCERPCASVRRVLERHLPRGPQVSLVEVGCAPGGWMAYFARRFGHGVAGIEYTAEGVAATRRNMELLGIDAEVIHADFLTCDTSRPRFDVVFSAGFAEHFDDLAMVAGRLCSLARRFVVTWVPNLLGVNGWISKTIRPAVYAGHAKIRRPMLRQAHEDAGMRTLFCGYVGGLRIVLPAAGRAFFQDHRAVTWAINFPFRALNRVLLLWEELCPRLSPGTRLLSPTLLYVGARDAPDAAGGQGGAAR